MNASLLLGIIIGMVFVLFCFGVFLALPARRMKNSNASFNEKSLEQLTERNAIGHEQIGALWKIAGYLAPRDTRAADRKARRERIAVPMMVASMRMSLQANFKNDEPEQVITKTTKVAMRYTDALIAELDKPEP